MFLSRIKASDDRSPFGDFWFSPVSTRSLSGMRVSADNAMCLSAVFRAVGLVSGHMAMLPLCFYKQGTRQKIKQHPLLKLLNVRPNRWQNAFEWREMVQGHIELRGNAYNEIYANGRGEITDLVPRHPDRVKVDVAENGDRKYIITNQDGTTRPVLQGQMWHLRGFSSNGMTGMSVIECARESFALGLSAQAYGARFFANDAKPSGGWIEYPGQFKDKTARLTFRESVQDAQSAANRGKLMVLDHGMKYHEVGLTNEDAQFLETRKFQISDVARWFGVPPHKIGDLERATFSNIEQMALEYIQDALQPRASRWESSIEADLLFDDEEIDVEFEFHELLRGDSQARSMYYHNGILDGWLTRNEARDMEGMEPIDGLSEPLRPLNMVEESDAEETEVEAVNQEAADTKPPEEDAGATDKDARLRAMIQSNAERLARRMAKAGQVTAEDADLIANALAITRVSAAAWCAFFVDVQFEADDEKTLCESLVRLGSK